jgi:L-asparaginase II
VIVGSVRSGLVEAVHPVVGAAVDSTGRVLVVLGDDSDRPFFYRSAVKPLQAAVCVRHGADLGPEQLALAAASHGGQRVHTSIVAKMLREVGLDTRHLRCPSEWPASAGEEARLRAAGLDAKSPLRHNCSGKHAAMLRACVSQDWSLEYTAADHPLQQDVVRFANEIVGAPVTPTGVDGCGVPVLRGDVVGLARFFAQAVTHRDLRPVAENSARFASLTSDGHRAEALLARWFPAVVKGGAMGCIGAGWLEGDIGLAVKSWSGQSAPAMVGLIALIERLWLLPAHPRSELAEIANPQVLGGGQPVGRLEVLA